MKCKFEVGQKVVCIKTQRTFIKKGGIYTVAEIGMGRNPHTGVIGVYVRLAEPGTNCEPEGGWRHTLFRPLNERKTDISIFERILDDCQKGREVEYHGR